MLNLDELAHVIINHAAPTLPPDSPPALSALHRGISRAKSAYQSCRYADVVERMPGLLRALEQFDHEADDARRHQLHRLKADAYHVSASVLLKCDERGLAWLAADRSFRAAQAPLDPVLIGSSSRVYVRALMRERRYRAAADLAVASAGGVERAEVSSAPATRSVSGSLLLSGAVAAAKHEDRDQSLSLLDEAQETANRLGGDHNHRWTACGPTNVLLHRVSQAVELGNAGQAIHQARGIDLAHIALTERKVVLHVDTARAFTQWGKLRQAHTALMAAENLAPEEVAERPMVHSLIRELRARSTGHLKRGLTSMADRVGVAW